MALVECRTAADVLENARAVKARLAALKPPAPPPPVVAPKPEPVPPADSADNRDAWLSWSGMLQAVDTLPPIPARGTSPSRPLQVVDIQRIVASVFGVTVIDLKAKRRDARVVYPRQIAMYLCKTLTLRSLPGIGRCFGNRDHTTVLHAVRKITALRRVEDDLDATLCEIEERLRPAANEETPAP